MRLETHTVRVGEWLGDVPDDWDYAGFFEKNLGPDNESHNKAVTLFKEMAEALDQGKTVWAAQRRGFSHKVYSCGLYDGWPFWKPRPCYVYEGPIPGECVEEYYNLRAIRIEEGTR